LRNEIFKYIIFLISTVLCRNHVSIDNNCREDKKRYSQCSLNILIDDASTKEINKLKKKNLKQIVEFIFMNIPLRLYQCVNKV